MLARFIRWYNKRNLIKLSQQITTTEVNKTTLSNFIIWSNSIFNYVEEGDLYKERLTVRFENIQALSIAIRTLKDNLLHDRMQPYLHKETFILVDDWFVDNESYRITLQEFIITNNDRLSAIVERLDTLDPTEIDFQLGNAYPILVTLQNIVELCHRRL